MAVPQRRRRHEENVRIVGWPTSGKGGKDFGVHPRNLHGACRNGLLLPSLWWGACCRANALKISREGLELSPGECRQLGDERLQFDNLHRVRGSGRDTVGEVFLATPDSAGFSLRTHQVENLGKPTLGFSCGYRFNGQGKLVLLHFLGDSSRYGIPAARTLRPCWCSSRAGSGRPSEVSRRCAARPCR